MVLSPFPKASSSILLKIRTAGCIEGVLRGLSMYPMFENIQGRPWTCYGGGTEVVGRSSVPIFIWWAGSTALGYGTFNLFPFESSVYITWHLKKNRLCLPQHLSLPIRLLKASSCSRFLCVSLSTKLSHRIKMKSPSSENTFHHFDK